MDVITKNLMVGLIRTIGAEKISATVSSFINTLIEKKKEIPLLDGETDIIILVYEIKGIAYFSQAAIRENGDNKTEITRQINTSKITDLVEKTINEL